MPRVGITTKDRLAWVTRTVNAYRQDQGESWSPGDWENARLELAVFTGIGKNLLPGHRGIMSGDGEISRPSQGEAKVILESFQRMFEDAVQHRPITLGPYQISHEMTWDTRTDRYHRWEEIERATWEDRACYALGQLLKEDGHRLRQCPAKLPHSGKACRKFFLKAKRGKYCSRPCASREMTRKFREKKGGSRHGTK